MRRLKLKSLNWKYIFGEVILIFLGINLAIWFNDWNTDRKINDSKEIAIDKIEEEIRNNIEELVRARQINTNIPGAVSAMTNMRSDNYQGTVATVAEMAAFRTSFPNFFQPSDSTLLEAGIYRYEGDTMINLELAELTEIAWETTKDMGIASEFGFDCLYQLENMYNVQRLVQKEINNSAEALQQSDIERLLRVLEFINQLDAQLERDYNRVLENLRICL